MVALLEVTKRSVPQVHAELIKTGRHEDELSVWVEREGRQDPDVVDLWSTVVKFVAAAPVAGVVLVSAWEGARAVPPAAVQGQGGVSARLPAADRGRRKKAGVSGGKQGGVQRVGEWAGRSVPPAAVREEPKGSGTHAGEEVPRIRCDR